VNVSKIPVLEPNRRLTVKKLCCKKCEQRKNGGNGECQIVSKFRRFSDFVVLYI